VLDSMAGLAFLLAAYFWLWRSGEGSPDHA
jgi:hypothetical protein